MPRHLSGELAETWTSQLVGPKPLASPWRPRLHRAWSPSSAFRRSLRRAARVGPGASSGDPDRRGRKEGLPNQEDMMLKPWFKRLTAANICIQGLSDWGSFTDSLSHACQKDTDRKSADLLVEDTWCPVDSWLAKLGEVMVPSAAACTKDDPWMEVWNEGCAFWFFCCMAKPVDRSMLFVVCRIVNGVVCSPT